MTGSPPIDRKLSTAAQAALVRLEQLLVEMPGVAIAFSGGMDSGFLAIAACRFKPGAMGAWTVASEFITEQEQDEAEQLAARFGIPLHRVAIGVLDDPMLRHNPPDRCYICKKAVFGRLLSSIPAGWQLCDGSNLDDRSDHRPGRKALRELAVASPLEESGFSKELIREVLRAWGFPEVVRPPKPCLATRFPHGTALSREILELVEHGEAILQATGFEQLRLRVHGDIARIEVPPDMLASAVTVLRGYIPALKGLGFRYVTLDLEGYRTGSMNEVRS